MNSQHFQTYRSSSNQDNINYSKTIQKNHYPHEKVYNKENYHYIINTNKSSHLQSQKDKLKSQPQFKKDMNESGCDEKSIYYQLGLGNSFVSDTFTSTNSQKRYITKQDDLQLQNYHSLQLHNQVEQNNTKRRTNKNMLQHSRNSQNIVKPLCNERNFHKQKPKCYKAEINQKLDRVCQKVQQLSKSRSKSKYSQQNLIQLKNQKIQSLKSHTKNVYKNQLCYADLVYEEQQNSKSIKSKYQFSEQSQIQLINLNKKLSQKSIKIQKLQKQIQQLKKSNLNQQKTWLKKQNELLRRLNSLEEQIQIYIIQNQNMEQKILENQQFCNQTPQNVVIEQGCNKLQQNIIKQQLLQPFNQLSSLTNLFIDWLSLMNRTKSEELPGTAFKVKQEMNLLQNHFNQIKSWCHENINKLINKQKQPIQSQVFLLQSYYNEIKTLSGNHLKNDKKINEKVNLLNRSKSNNKRPSSLSISKSKSKNGPNKQTKSKPLVSESIYQSNFKYDNQMNTSKDLATKRLFKQSYQIEEDMISNLDNKNKNEQRIYQNRRKENVKFNINFQCDQSFYHIIYLQAQSIEQMFKGKSTHIQTKNNFNYQVNQIIEQSLLSHQDF